MGFVCETRNAARWMWWPTLQVALIASFTGLNSGLAAQVRVVAHRGLLHHAPENTLANFRACLHQLSQ